MHINPNILYKRNSGSQEYGQFLEQSLQRDSKNYPKQDQWLQISNFSTKRTFSLHRVVLNTENEKAILLWKGPGKETRSSRQRRELNAGKGVGI